MQRKIKSVVNAMIDAKKPLGIIQMKSKPAALSVVIQRFTVAIQTMVVRKMALPNVAFAKTITAMYRQHRKTTKVPLSLLNQ